MRSSSNLTAWRKDKFPLSLSCLPEIILYSLVLVAIKVLLFVLLSYPRILTRISHDMV